MRLDGAYYYKGEGALFYIVVGIDILRIKWIVSNGWEKVGRVVHLGPIQCNPPVVGMIWGPRG